MIVKRGALGVRSSLAGPNPVQTGKPRVYHTNVSKQIVIDHILTVPLQLPTKYCEQLPSGSSEF